MKESAVEKNRSMHDLVEGPAGYLERGWVIANHKLVSFHAAFISSVLSLPAAELTARAAAGENIKSVVLQFMFSPMHMELWISLAILYLSWHIAIAVHEMGHFLTAAKLTALNKDSQEKADAALKSGNKFGYYAQMFLLIPWGKFYGVRKENGNFAPDAPYNLAVSAAAPIWSQWLATICLPIAAFFIIVASHWLQIRAAADTARLYGASGAKLPFSLRTP